MGAINSNNVTATRRIPIFMLKYKQKRETIQATAKLFQEFSSSQWSHALEAFVRHHRIFLQPLSSGDGSLLLSPAQVASH